MPPKIFISYSRANIEAVNSIVFDISSMGYDVWLDKALTGGENWWNAILHNILDREIFVLILSKDSLNSIACRHEYEYAESLNKPIIPILVENNISIALLPPALSKVQILEHHNNDKSDILNLIKAFNGIKINPLPNLLPDPPEIPISYLGKVTQQIESDKTLNYEKQISLVSEIKRYIDQSDYNNDDMLILLKKFRRRRDLYAHASDDIDVLLNKIDKNHFESKRNISELLEENTQLKKENTNLNSIINNNNKIQKQFEDSLIEISKKNNELEQSKNAQSQLESEIAQFNKIIKIKEKLEIEMKDHIKDLNEENNSLKTRIAELEEFKSKIIVNNMPKW